jgi:hypothetical protein
MVGIGADIKDVLQELGTSLTIYKRSGAVITGEFIDYEHYFEQSTEFIRQWSYSGDFQYDTQAEEGDVLYFDGNFYLLMNLKRTLFENEPVDCSGFFILCNCTNAAIKKAVQTRDATTKKLSTSWVAVETGMKALIHGGDLAYENRSEMVMGNPIGSFDLFCPLNTSFLEGHRFYPDATVTDVYYKIARVKPYRYRNIFYASVEEEARE